MQAMQGMQGKRGTDGRSELPRGAPVLHSSDRGEQEAIGNVITSAMAARQSAAAGRCTTSPDRRASRPTDRSPLAALSNAETDARAEYDTNHMEALLARRIAVGKLIGGNAYNQERQVASDKAKVPDRAKAATDKRQVEADADALARHAAERELRKHAEDDARASAARRVRATQTETARDDRSEDALRTQASREARTSSARHHHDDNVRFAAEEQSSPSGCSRWRSS